MKKCDWCGQKYPDATEHCAVDGRPLREDSEQGVASFESVAGSTQIVENLPSPAKADQPSDYRLRWFELLLVCVAAFGGNILNSAALLFTANEQRRAVGTLNWIHMAMLEATSLALVWYVLSRRSSSFRQLGLTWTKKDVGWSFLVWLGSCLAFYCAYQAIYSMGFAAATEAEASARVTHLLFARGISFFTFGLAFLNPFFEELIVRAYVITEVRALTGSTAIAIALSTALQTSYHLYQGVPLALAEGVMFFGFSVYYARTNRITPVVLAHLYLDLLPMLQLWVSQK